MVGSVEVWGIGDHEQLPLDGGLVPAVLLLLMMSDEEGLFELDNCGEKDNDDNEPPPPPPPLRSADNSRLLLILPHGLPMVLPRGLLMFV